MNNPTRTPMKVTRRIAQAGYDPFAFSNGQNVRWESRHVVLEGFDRTEAEAEFPTHFSDRAANIVYNQYFSAPSEELRITNQLYSELAVPGQRETSLRQVLDRVSSTIAAWGREDGYFAEEDSLAFRDELNAILLWQYASFNSPVWFNLGIMPNPQCSACFIQSVQDDMGSIMDLAKSEVLIFKHGSGTGTNLSSLRSSGERINGKGKAGGPVAFMRGYDAFAGVIKSGSRTRKAAKMTILDADHPDIREFIESKVFAQDMIDDLNSGPSGRFCRDQYFNDPYSAPANVPFQNANHSVRVSNLFMEKATGKDPDPKYPLLARTTGEVAATDDARQVLQSMAQACYRCGDPGIQFDDTINLWNKVPNSGRIRASNPCSEYMFLDDSACNLASLNLTRFLSADGKEFDVDKYVHVAQVMLTAMEILVDRSSYPTREIRLNSADFRPLGLGYCDLGNLLMLMGLPYDSREGRAMAGAVTSVLGGAAALQSATMAKHRGPFRRYGDNAVPFLQVIGMHTNWAEAQCAEAVQNPGFPEAVRTVATAGLKLWQLAWREGKDYGFRNAQFTLLAPTGAISFFMDAETTGCEPAVALVSEKTLAHGSKVMMYLRSVPRALRNLGYSEGGVQAIQERVEETGTIEGCSFMDDKDLPVFDCAFQSPGGERFLSPEAHVRMMHAVQPFLCGAISKTVNLPSTTTAEDIAKIWTLAWDLGLKAVAVYRDGSKGQQPINVKAGKAHRCEKAPGEAGSSVAPERHRLPDTRPAVTHKFCVGQQEGYVTVGIYPDSGLPGEVFLNINKEGSMASGLADGFACLLSICLQYGVPLDVLIAKFRHTRFEPSGFTQNREIPQATSILDYLFQWLSLQFDGQEGRRELGAVLVGAGADPGPDGRERKVSMVAAPYSCPKCGATGTKFGCACPNCGDATSCG